MATCQCNHRYCAACIDRIQRGRPCPVCRQPFDLVDDNHLERVLNSYNVYCPNKEKGCQWKGKLGKLESHLNRNAEPDKLLEGCKFQDIPCTLCQSYRCERWLMADHVSIDCPNRDVEYEYHYAGCDFKKPKPQLEQHMKDSVSLHLSLVSDQMSSMKEKVYELKNELREYKKSQRKIATSIVIASILFASLLVFLNMWQIDSSMLKIEEDMSTQQQASKLEVMNLTKQQFEVLREELKEYLSTTNKLEIDRLVKHTYSENTVSSQFSDTSCKYTCPSLPEARLNMIETEIEYLHCKNGRVNFTPKLE